MIRLSYRLVGPDQVPDRRAGRGPRLADPGRLDAVDAAGAIHTDLARGFIRAETIALRGAAGRWGPSPRRKKHGKVRSEGKTYRVRDGDVIEILFSR